MRSNITVLVFDGFADWEPAFALAELRRSGGRAVRTVGFTDAPVTSMGGLRVMPDAALSALHADDVELLLLPGGDMWETGDYPSAELDALIGHLAAAGSPVGAICAGTLALGRAGVLDDRRHTSNMRGYLELHVPAYRGAEHYADAPAVNDRGIITASGLAPVDFAREIFRQLGVFGPEDDAAWYDMFRHGRMP